MFKHLKKAYAHFEQTLAEANYHSEPGSVWDFFTFGKAKIPETSTSLVMSSKMIGTSQTVGKRFMWAAVFAALSVNTLLATAGVLVLAGSGIIALEYHRCRKAREDIITEVNFAGQKVQGKRYDLCRLHNAQVRIMEISSSFKKASLESSSDTIQSIIETVSEERQRVRIIDTGPYGALDSTYDFSRPAITLVNQDERNEAARIARENAARVAAEPQPAMFDKKVVPLRETFRLQRQRDEEILDKLVDLHKSLPPRLQKRYMRELRKNNGAGK